MVAVVGSLRPFGDIQLSSPSSLAPETVIVPSVHVSIQLPPRSLQLHRSMRRSSLSITARPTTQRRSSTHRRAANATPLQLLFEPKAGLARADNHAIRFARGEVLAFTDDNCRLHPQYVNDLLRYDAEDKGLLLRGGRIELGDPTDLPLTINTSPTPMRWIRGMNLRKSKIFNRLLLVPCPAPRFCLVEAASEMNSLVRQII
jgi:hypothetical protein